MCKHFIMVPRNEVELIIRDIEIDNHVNIMPDWPARGADAYPQSIVPLIVSESSGLAVAEKTWGYAVPWKKGVVFNTRSETALGEKGALWRDSLLNRRCVIPAFGFFESHRTEMSFSERTGKPIKRQYRFDGPRSLLFMAGIYQNDRFSLMTTAPNAAVEPVHDRMPVVLLEHELGLWFSPDFQVLFDRTGIELIATSRGIEASGATDAKAEQSARSASQNTIPGQSPLWEDGECSSDTA